MNPGSVTTSSERFPATRTVADFSLKFALDTVAPDVVERAALLVLDLLGVSLAATAPGQLENLDQLVDLVAHGPATATVFGHGRITGPAEAALLNGYLAHLLEWDDATLKPIGHPSITILPAVLALGEAHGASGSEVLEAYLVGLEVHSRLGQAQSRPWSSADPWLPIGHIGVVGATVGCARLLGLDALRTAHAIGLASHFSGGLGISGGTEAKPLGAGHAARSAVSAAQLAGAGVTAPTDALEADGGFADTFFGPDGHDLEKALSGLGTGRLHIEEIGVAIKRYPTVYGTHWAADAFRLLTTRHHLLPQDIASVALVYPAASAFVDNPTPKTSDEARFSQQYLLATCWVFGKPLPEHFTAAAIDSAPMRRTLELVSARPHAEGTPAPQNWAYDVTVTTIDGRRLTASVPRPHGHPRDPLTPDEVREKFRDATTTVLGDGGAARVIDLVARLRELSDVGILTAELGLNHHPVQHNPSR